MATTCIALDLFNFIVSDGSLFLVAASLDERIKHIKPTLDAVQCSVVLDCFGLLVEAKSLEFWQRSLETFLTCAHL